MSGREDQAGDRSDALTQMTNLPNLLSLARIAAVPMIVWLFISTVSMIVVTLIFSKLTETEFAAMH